MLARPASKLAALLLAAAAPAVAGAPAPRFERAFTTAGEPRFLHATIAFAGPDGLHRMEIWRDGDRRVKRVTDAALVSVATHKPGDPAYALHLLDLKRRISTRIDRDSLYKVGNFTDWFDLTHGLRHPMDGYALAASRDVPGTLPATVESCRWWDLTQNEHVAHICWGTGARLPLLIADAQWRPVWRVLAIDRRPVPAGIFVLDDRGFVKNDAASDISPD